MKYTFEDGEIVKFDNGVIKGEGCVIGCSNLDQVIIGGTYIIHVYSSDVELPNETYPYSTIPMSECHIEKLK